MTESVFINVRDFAKISGIGINSAYKLTKVKDFPAVMHGRLIKVHREKAIKWLESYVDGMNADATSDELHSGN